MATYMTTYDAGIAKMETAGNHDPADATAPAWDPAADPDTGHPTSADKPIDERVPWDVPVADDDPAHETPPVDELPPEGGVRSDPPAGKTRYQGSKTSLEGEDA